MTSAPFGFGIIGPGMIAGVHARAIAQIPGARLVGVAGRDGPKARIFAETHGAKFWTTDIGELVRHPQVHAICITAPSGAHLEPGLAAIAAGKHVVVEKPLEITLARADRLMAAAQAAGVLVVPILPARFGDGARRLKAAVAAGRFGRLVLCSASVKWHRSAAYYQNTWKGSARLDGGGAVMNQAIHAIDLLQWLVGMPSEIFGRTTRRVHTGIEVEDTAAATLMFADGALGVIEASTASYPGWERRIEIGGETGSARLEDELLTRWEFSEKLPGDAQVTVGGNPAGLAQTASAPGSVNPEGHRRQLEDLMNAVHSARRPAIEGLEARNAITLITGLYESAARNSVVKL